MIVTSVHVIRFLHSLQVKALVWFWWIDETLESLSQYSAELDARMDLEFGNEQGGDAGGWDGNNEGGANNDSGARVGDEDDLSPWTRDFTT